MPFKTGEVYLINCTYINPPKDKFAICVCEKKPLLFFINSKPRKYFHPDSQLLAKTTDFPFLKYDSYINTADIVTCVVPITCTVKKQFGNIPSNIRGEIKKAVEGSNTLPPRFIKNILKRL